MKNLSLSLKVCKHQLRLLGGNYKVYMLPVCLLAFFSAATFPLRDFLIASGEKASPFFMPFLFSDTFLEALIFAAILFFFSDAPFYEKNQLFVVLRSGTRPWVLGQILYVFAVSVLYMCFLLLMSILLLLPYVTMELQWGRIWTTLAMTDAGSSFFIPFYVSQVLIFNFSPLQAVSLIFFMGFLVCAFYGFLVWAMNLYIGKVLSMSISLTTILLATRVRYFPSWVIYLVPGAWTDVSNLIGVTPHGLTIPKAVLILAVEILLLCGVIFFKSEHSDIEKW